MNSTAQIIFILLGISLLGLVIWRLRSPQKKSKMTPKEIETATPKPEVEALVIGSPEKPLLEIHPAPPGADLVPLEATPAMKIALEPILQRAPEMLHIGSRMASEGYRVVFSPEVTKALRSGAAELLPSSGKLLPVARDASKGGKFVEIARVSKDTGLKLAGVAAMSWQLLSIATAQHFLNEINARLAGIENGINDIRAWLEEEKKGELRASLRYLREISAALSRGQLHPDEIQAFYGQLDTIERISVAIGELAREVSARRLCELERLDIREWTARGVSAHRVWEWIQHTKQAIDLIMLAQTVRVVGCEVKSMLPGDQQRLEERLEHARQEVENAQNLFESTQNAFFAKIHELRKRNDNFWALGGLLDDDHRGRLENDFVAVREAISQATTRFKTESNQALDMARQLDAIGEAGMELEIRPDERGELQIFTPRKNAA
jgi:hypothetical protein